MRWLLRYARPCGVVLDHPMGEAHALRAKFEPAGWRMMCRWGRAPFLPVLRNTWFGFADLQQYIAVVVSTRWMVPPPPHLVQHVIDQSYPYRDEPPDVPTGERDLQLLRFAARSSNVSRKSFAQVLEWVVREKPNIEHRRSWTRMVNQGTRVESVRVLELANVYFEPWHCAITMIHIDGYRCVALETPWELWEEGVAMFHCVYALRRFSEARRPSRFFSLRKGASRIATAEIRPCFLAIWRRERDSNPRGVISPHTLSRRAT